MVFGTPTMRRPSWDMRVAARQRALAADGDDGVDAVALHRALHLLQAALDLEGVDARGAQDGAAAVEDAGGRLPGEAEVVVLQQALPAVPQAHHLEAVLAGAADDGADDRVEAGAITPAGQDGDFHRVRCSSALIPSVTHGNASALALERYRPCPSSEEKRDTERSTGARTPARQPGARGPARGARPGCAAARHGPPQARMSTTPVPMRTIAASFCAVTGSPKRRAPLMTAAVIPTQRLRAS